MLKAGIMEEGLVQTAEVGTPQGSILSPLLLCEFARKKENPSLERYIEPPYALFVVY
jgi:retron-type reverse transcriptase